MLYANGMTVSRRGKQEQLKEVVLHAVYSSDDLSKGAMLKQETEF